MNKRKIQGNILIVLGLLCFIGAGLYYLHNAMESKRAYESSMIAREALIEEISREHQIDLNPDILSRTMETVEVDGIKYIGLIEVPDLNISLPVIEYWSEDYLKIAPCRFSGSYYRDDLVLCAHSYVSHFRPLRNIPMGADVYFTTVTGEVYHYVVTYTETIYPNEKDKMIINDINDDMINDWDLTLFTCTADMQARHTVRCERIDDSN
ncbi:MAG: sortase [Erysipelotrichaceae bacterium]|nr:sortase [Erysipelotrichaceae bacterium]